MAAFYDQFERTDPLLAKFDAPSESWHRRIAFEARTVLSPEARENLKRIAYTIDNFVSRRALKSTAPVRFAGGSERTERDAETQQARKDVARQVHGDLALFEAAGGAIEVRDLLRTAHSTIDAADLYAAFALWKLADYVDSVRRPPSAKNHVLFAWASLASDGRPPPATAIRARICDALLAEAAHASATAWRLRQEALQVAGPAEREQASRNEADFADRLEREIEQITSQRAKRAADVKHDLPGGSRAKQAAIRAAWATGKYSSRDICAEEECGALGMSFATARKALRNTPKPT